MATDPEWRISAEVCRQARELTAAAKTEVAVSQHMRASARDTRERGKALRVQTCNLRTLVEEPSPAPGTTDRCWSSVVRSDFAVRTGHLQEVHTMPVVGDSDRRDRDAEGRDDIADVRDCAAGTRDQESDARDYAAESRDEVAVARGVQLSDTLGAAEQRDLVAARRDLNAQDREDAAALLHRDLDDLNSIWEQAAIDRAMAATDRRAAGLDRLLIRSELQLIRLDRRQSAVDRRAAASDRAAAAADRRAAACDRTAAQAARQQAAVERAQRLGGTPDRSAAGAGTSTPRPAAAPD